MDPVRLAKKLTRLGMPLLVFVSASAVEEPKYEGWGVAVIAGCLVLVRVEVVDVDKVQKRPSIPWLPRPPLYYFRVVVLATRWVDREIIVSNPRLLLSDHPPRPRTQPLLFFLKQRLPRKIKSTVVISVRTRPRQPSSYHRLHDLVDIRCAVFLEGIFARDQVPVQYNEVC